MENTSHKPKLGGKLHNTQLALFKIVKDIPEEATKTRRPSVMWYPGWNPGAEKEH